MKIILDPLPTAVFVLVLLCWLTFAAIFIFRKKPPASATVESRRERASLIGILLQGFGYALIWIVRRQYFSPIAPMSKPLEIALAVLTVALSIASVWLVVAAVKTLGKQWSF